MTEGGRKNAATIHGAETARDPGVRLCRLLDRQIELSRDLDALSRDQSGLIETGDTDGLLALLGRRQGLIEQLSELSSEVEPLRLAWLGHESSAGAVARTEIESRIATLEALIESIGRRDDADRARLEQGRAATLEEISSLNRGRNAVAAYGSKPAGAGGARYQDYEA